MLAKTAIAALWMLTTLVWVVSWGIIMAWEYPNDPHKLRAAAMAVIPAIIPASTAIWIMTL